MRQFAFFAVLVNACVADGIAVVPRLRIAKVRGRRSSRRRRSRPSVRSRSGSTPRRPKACRLGSSDLPGVGMAATR